MPTATIGVTQVDGQRRFELQGTSSTIEVIEPVEIDLTPTISDTTYTVTFVPITPVLGVVGGSASSSNVTFEHGQEPGTLVATCTYPQEPVSSAFTVDFSLSLELPDSSGQALILKVAIFDPTFVFKPPS